MRNKIFLVMLLAGCAVEGEGFRKEDFADGGDGEAVEDQESDDFDDFVVEIRESQVTPEKDLAWGEPCLWAYGSVGCPCAHDCCFGENIVCNVDLDLCEDSTNPE